MGYFVCLMSMILLSGGGGTYACNFGNLSGAFTDIGGVDPIIFNSDTTTNNPISDYH